MMRALVSDSWGPVLDEITVEGGGTSLNLLDVASDDPDAQLLLGVVGDEIASLNADFKLPETIDIRIEDCGEPNAFYDGCGVAIIMCTEFVGQLRQNLPN